MDGKKAYLEWLMDQMQIDRDGPEGYEKLCGVLMDIPFSWSIAMDSNRADEGRQLRGEWMGDSGDTLKLRGVPDWTCTMMELLCVMARKLQYETLLSDYEAGIRKWFMELLSNIGLDEYINEAFDEDYDQFDAETRATVDAVIFRQYGWDGEGGLFPLMYPQRDQRRIELTDQMNDYLEENYEIF